MEITIVILAIAVIVLLGMFLELKYREPKIEERIEEKIVERVVERTIQIDASAEEKAKFAEYYRIKQKELDDRLAEENRKLIKNLEDEIELKRIDYLKRLDNELYIYEENKETKISQIDVAFENYKSKMRESALELQNTVQSIKETIEEWRNKYSGAVETFKNLEKLKDKDNFYKIILTDEELDELNELNHAVKKLRNPVPFYKAIFEIYYKNKISDLVLRVVGKTRVSGIYKITHIPSGKVYIGQSVDIGDRWKQHVKRGCGADAWTNNKLYPAMMENGIHTFAFEIVEVTEDTSKLNEMEKYWQEFFQAKEFGYSMK